MIDTLIVVLSLQLMVGYDATGFEVFRSEVAIGQSTHPTPTADTFIDNVVIHPYWIPTYGAGVAVPPRHPDNAMGVAKVTMRGMGAIRIHGTDGPWPSVNGPRLMSSGCVRLLQRDMQKLSHMLVGEIDWEKEDQWLAPKRRVRVVIRQ
jgi:murein L,D-transpeptidase YcbB/YkuD